MNGPVSKSAGISPRRRLLEEVLLERSRVVAGLPADQQEPGPRSPLWPTGATRLAVRRTRQGALDLAVLALAWLERFDADAQPERPGEIVGVDEQLRELEEG